MFSQEKPIFLTRDKSLTKKKVLLKGKSFTMNLDRNFAKYRVLAKKI
jgi:hypothetical protein